MRHDWSIDELDNIYHLPLFELLYQASRIHAKYHNYQEIQTCRLFSIKTGGCSEDCKYCAQSARYQTNVSAEKMLPLEQVVAMAKEAIAEGATRICLSVAQREVRDNKQFENVLAIVRAIADLNVEVCCTLGMLNSHQAKRLKEAGLFAYNHNLDTSEKFYPSIITTRTYQDRLKTLDIVAQEKIHVCCGCILGLGETILDRLEFLQTLSQRQPHPQSVPINRLVPIPGTPLANQPKTTTWEVVRMIATTRIVLPRSMIRLSAGRKDWSLEQHALCFFAGANSIFLGPKLLTVKNSLKKNDEEMFQLFGLKKMRNTCATS